MSSLRKTIAELHDAGLRNPEIARELRVAPTTVSYHRGRILAERAAAYRGRDNLKIRLIKEGLKESRCERCGLAEWSGEPLTMALHHVNGDRHDNRLANLQLLCPNCHSQTDTYAGRNGRDRPKRR